MIAACPKCSARYRVDSDKVGPEGARLRCAKCEAVFRVRLPEGPSAAAPAAPAAASPAAAPQTTPAEQPVATPAAPAPAPPAGAEPRVDRSRAILIADPDPESGKATQNVLASWGLQPILVHDGVEAMMTIQRALPRVVVLDAALPKMFGFQICEVMKRNESLRDIRVILVGSIHHESRYRRPPTDLYGADLYLEHPDLPEGLRPLLEQSGLRLDAGPAPAAPAAAPQPRPVPEPIAAPPPAASQEPTASQEPIASARPAAPAPEAVAPVDELSEERQKAERLARIIVSDIVLYQPDKFDEAVRAGNVAAAMDSSLEEGRRLMRERIDESVLSEQDHLVTELERVAAERKTQ